MRLKKWLKRITNRFTCLHQIYGYQKAVMQSETQNNNLETGVAYFNGLKKEENRLKLKSDCYKHIIRSDILKILYGIIKKHLKK
jgi:hypothetical protein